MIWTRILFASVEAYNAARVSRATARVPAASRPRSLPEKAPTTNHPAAAPVESGVRSQQGGYECNATQRGWSRGRAGTEAATGQKGRR